MLATRGARVTRVEVSSAVSPFGRAGCLSGNARPATAWSPSAAATSSSLRHSLLAGGPTGRRDLRARAKSRPLKPDDSPLRDGNRDRLLGLLTERAARTLLFYCSETNQHLYHWLNEYIKQNPIPRNGQYQDISGESLARDGRHFLFPGARRLSLAHTRSAFFLSSLSFPKFQARRS